MIEPYEAAIVDECLAQLTALLSKKGLTLEQRVGYKAGKLPGGRNWCQLVDGDVALRVQFPNRHGQLKTWKVFARFDAKQAPSEPWDRPQEYERVKAQWMPAGPDVWGIAYDDIKGWAEQFICAQLLQRLVADLEISFKYARRHYK